MASRTTRSIYSPRKLTTLAKIRKNQLTQNSYRLATVAGGCLVGFIWTYFPYPITARGTLRRQLGESLYLLANYYSCVHTTVWMRIEGGKGDSGDKASPQRRLEKVRGQILAKEMALFAQLRQHSASTAFEPTFGGKFPKAQYDTIIQEVQRYVFDV